MKRILLTATLLAPLAMLHPAPAAAQSKSDTPGGSGQTGTGAGTTTPQPAGTGTGGTVGFPPDTSSIEFDKDGTRIDRLKDGGRREFRKDGSIWSFDKDGKIVAVVAPVAVAPVVVAPQPKTQPQPETPRTGFTDPEEHKAIKKMVEEERAKQPKQATPSAPPADEGIWDEHFRRIREAERMFAPKRKDGDHKDGTSLRDDKSDKRDARDQHTKFVDRNRSTGGLAARTEHARLDRGASGFANWHASLRPVSMRMNDGMSSASRMGGHLGMGSRFSMGGFRSTGMGMGMMHGARFGRI